MAPILTPANEIELTALIRQAGASKTLLYPVGDGTCRFEFSHPKEQISLSAFSRIVRLEPQDFYVTCGAGIQLSELHRELSRLKLHFPFLSPDSPGSVGGMIASGYVMSGQYFHRISRWVLASRVAMADGEIIKSGAVTYKSVAGYDLTKIFCGSYGTLGIIIEVSLRLYPGEAGPYGKDLEPVRVRIPRLGHISQLQSPVNRAEEISQRIKRSFDPEGVFAAIIGWNA